MKTILSWSSGKDSAWTLHQLRSDPTVEVVALLTTVNDAFDRVAMHGLLASFDSLVPVSRLSVAMHHCNDVKKFVLDRVKNSIREYMNKQSSNISIESSPPLRRITCTVDC